MINNALLVMKKKAIKKENKLNRLSNGSRLPSFTHRAESDSFASNTSLQQLRSSFSVSLSIFLSLTAFTSLLSPLPLALSPPLHPQSLSSSSLCPERTGTKLTHPWGARSISISPHYNLKSFKGNIHVNAANTPQSFGV